MQANSLVKAKMSTYSERKPILKNCGLVSGVSLTLRLAKVALLLAKLLKKGHYRYLAVVFSWRSNKATSVFPSFSYLAQDLLVYGGLSQKLSGSIAIALLSSHWQLLPNGEQTFVFVIASL